MAEIQILRCRFWRFLSCRGLRCGFPCIFGFLLGLKLIGSYLRHRRFGGLDVRIEVQRLLIVVFCFRDVALFLISVAAAGECKGQLRIKLDRFAQIRQSKLECLFSKICDSASEIGIGGLRLHLDRLPEISKRSVKVAFLAICHRAAHIKIEIGWRRCRYGRRIRFYLCRFFHDKRSFDHDAFFADRIHEAAVGAGGLEFFLDLWRKRKSNTSLHDRVRQDLVPLG